VVNQSIKVSKTLYYWSLSLASFRFCETQYLHFTTRVFGHSASTPSLGGITHVFFPLHDRIVCAQPIFHVFFEIRFEIDTSQITGPVVFLRYPFFPFFLARKSNAWGVRFDRKKLSRFHQIGLLRCPIWQDRTSHTLNFQKCWKNG